MADLKKKPFLELTNFSGTDLQYRGAQGSKASPTTSTSTKFYSLIDKEKPSIKKVPLTGKKLKEALTVNPLIDTEEVKLLCRLFLPKKGGSQGLNLKHLGFDTNQTIKQLQTSLPLLIPHSNETTNMAYPKLNFELHMFLAGIMVNFVTNWYFGKLNTDNLEFIMNIYQVLCEFVKDMANRFSIMLNQDNLLIRVSELSDIVNDHLTDLVGEKTFKTIETYRTNPEHVVIDDQKSDEAIIQEYLKSKHVMFESSESKQMYLRVLVKNLLLVVFPPNGDQHSGGGPLNTKIGHGFVNIIVADLVLDKIVTKLSTPEFILSIIDKITRAIKAKLDQRLISHTASPRISIRDRIKKLFTLSYKDLSYLMIYNHYTTNTVTKNTHNILDNRIFKLLDTLSGFSNRKPLLNSIISTVSTVVSSNEKVSNKVNEVLKKNIFRSLIQSNVMNDDSMSKILFELRSNLFTEDRSSSASITPESRSQTPSSLQSAVQSPACSAIQSPSQSSTHLPVEITSNANATNSSKTETNVNDATNEIFNAKNATTNANSTNTIPDIKQMAQDILEVLTHKSLPFQILPYFKYASETDEDILRSIESQLRIFQLPSDHSLNQLLIIRIFDTLIANLYGELT